jgi:dienelactone hydrolase
MAMKAEAAVRTETVEYADGSVALEGFFAYDDAVAGKRPGIVVVHEWWGLNDYVKTRARMLAEMGYVAFACDMYGKGRRASTPEEARALAGEIRADRPLMRRRAQAALQTLKKHPLCNATRTAAIGYCFGGGVVLELARSGAEVSGVVSFHGNLDTPNPEGTKDVKAKVLVCHGADDASVSMDAVKAFVEEMRAAKVDYQVVIYGGAVHGFTNSASAAYNEPADRRSWQAMQGFFNELFKKGQ